MSMQPVRLNANLAKVTGEHIKGISIANLAIKAPATRRVLADLTQMLGENVVIVIMPAQTRMDIESEPAQVPMEGQP